MSSDRRAPRLVAPPRARIEPHVTEIHGRRLEDGYHWLRRRGEREVIDYLEAENAYTEGMMAGSEALQETLYRELLGRIQEDDASAPVREGGSWYYTRTETGRPYPIYCRKEGSLEAAEQVILDVNALADGHDFFRLGVVEPSPDGRLLAFSFDTRGDEVYTLVVKDLATGVLLPDRIEGTSASLVWAEDKEHLFYTTLDAVRRPHKVFRHRLGGGEDGDAEVFHESDERFFVRLGKTRSRAYLLIALDSAVTSEVHLLEAERPRGRFRLFRRRRQGVEYDLDHRGDLFYVRTNDGAKNFRLMAAPVDGFDHEAAWREVVPHRLEVKLEGVDLFRDWMVRREREAGLGRLVVTRFADRSERAIELPEAVYALWPGDNPEFDADAYRFGFSSLVTPATDFDYLFAERRLVVRKRQPVLGGYDPSLYVSERIHATAPDGTAVPVSLVHRRDLARDGSHPCLLYGYGAYGATIEPSFSHDNVSLLERGFVYAVAHVRGGGLLGEPWHDGGKMLAKRNTFTDFIAVAEHLIAEGYTSSERLAIRGGSAGGLLVGAVLNLRPDLFAAAAALVPFVDVVHTMLDEAIPLTVIEYEEWGDPANEEQLDYMLSYSPYDNVTRRDYPPLLVTAGLHDPRVQYWEPAKWVARLRSMKTDGNRLLLKTHMGAGHAGPSGRYGRLRERAFELAFLFAELGIEG